MAENENKQYRYSINICQRAKDGRWIADEVKVKSDVKEELDGMLSHALEVANKKLATQNKEK